MSGNEDKAIRLLEYLLRVASLRTKIVRNIVEYPQIVWLYEIPKEKNCFTQAWRLDESYDQDIWIEIQTTHEPELPSIPDLCRDWVNLDTLRKTSDLPELLNEITRQIENPEWKEGTDQPQFINQKISLQMHPEVSELWERFIEEKWLPWAEKHQRWEAVHNVYSTLFAIYQEQLRLGEEYELVLGIGLLSWKTLSDKRVRRHLIVANALLEFEARLGKFTVRPNPDGANLRPELDMLDIEEQPVRAEEMAKNGLKEAADDPWNQDCMEGTLKAIVHSINPHDEFHYRMEAKKPEYSEKPMVEYAPALILRKRSVRGLTEILKRIKNRIEDGGTIPHEFADIAEIEKSEREISSEPDADLDGQTDAEIYFPKPSNAEQLRIVEKIKSARGIIVQGPPGTGKSHTIANLICHMLATGQRTLVTAKTPRALKVLERLLPEEMRPLCVNLLGSGLDEKRSLEASVRALLIQSGQWNENHSKKEIQKNEDALYRLRGERAEIEKRLRAIRESETHSQVIADGAYRGTAAQIAQAVNKDEKTYDWFTDPVPLNSQPPLSEHELYRLLKGLRVLTPTKRKELGLSWPESLPSVKRFKDLVEEENEAKDQEKKTAINIDREALQQLSSLHEEKILSIEKNFTQLRNEILRLKSLPHTWVTNALRDISLGNDGVWKELLKTSAQIIFHVAKLVKTADETRLTIPDDRELKTVHEDAETLKEHILNGGKLGWGPFRPKIVKSVMYIIKNVRVNDRFCDELDRISLLVDVLRVQIELERGWNFWSGKTKKVEGPYSLQFREFESLAKALDETLSIKKKINQCKDSLLQISSFGVVAWDDPERLMTLIQTCIHLLTRIRIEKVLYEFKKIEEPIEVLTKGNAHPVVNELLETIRDRNVDAFARCYEKIERLRKEKKYVLWIDNTFKRLKDAAPTLADTISENPVDASWDNRIKQMLSAWRWSQARTWLQDYIRKEDAPSLEKRVRQIEDETGKIIASIAALHTWSFCFRRMKEDHRRHMEAWQQSMRKLGKGTGKHAPKHRRDAQRHLNQCRDAVPAWIMPLHRVWDTVDPAPGIFDLIVVDEASQCGLEALPLFYLGKKILIVGDDKQISPDAVGIPRDAVRRLMEEHLHDFQFKDSFDVESSLFDHGKLRYGTQRITLREHFRCMPEIIRYSNNLCYSDTPLIPLRQYGSERLEPIQHVYLTNGYREGFGSGVINRSEAETIVGKVVELCKDQSYENKTIGVIVLQGEAQGRLIEDQLLSLLGAEEMEKRRLVCGNPYSFQGDERDIMFLSMVAAPNERIGPLTMSADERRFNVAASRARDQIWLYHSVTRDDLSASCLRRSLLEFFEETKIEPIIGFNFEELRKSAHQTNRFIVKPPHPLDSWFEVDVALEIAKKDYCVIPQFEVAGKFIDLVVEGGQSRLAVECDGDEFHGTEQYEEDMQRQRMLERCGWAFFRIRASAFYANKEDSLKGLLMMLEERGIQPQGKESTTSDEQDSWFQEETLDNGKPESGFEEEAPERSRRSPIGSERIEIDDTVVYTMDEHPDSEKQVMITRGTSDPDMGTINFRTPMAEALLGAQVGDFVEAKLPMGVRKLKIQQIRKNRS